MDIEQVMDLTEAARKAEKRAKFTAYMRSRRHHIAEGTWKPTKRGKVAEVHNPLPVAGKTIADALAGLGE